jgi:hypothetical protein
MTTYTEVHKRYYEKNKELINDRRREKAKLHQRIYSERKRQEKNLLKESNEGSTVLINHSN